MRCSNPECNNEARTNKPGSACSQKCATHLHYILNRKKSVTQKCANPECENIARTTRIGSTCGRKCDKRLQNIRLKLERKTAWEANTPKCANPECDKPARSVKKNSFCSDECNWHTRAMIRAQKRQAAEAPEAPKTPKAVPGKCANPTCDKQARTTRVNSCCSPACVAIITNANRPSRATLPINTTRICAADGCNNIARRDKPGSYCSQACERRMTKKRARALYNADKPFVKCANPTCDKRARTQKQGSTCSPVCHDAVKIIRRREANLRIEKTTKAREAIMRLARERGIKHAEFGRNTEGLEIAAKRTGREYIQKPARYMETDSISLRADAIAEAAKQPGYDRHNLADIHRRVEEILARWQTK